MRNNIKCIGILFVIYFCKGDMSFDGFFKAELKELSTSTCFVLSTRLKNNICAATV